MIKNLPANAGDARNVGSIPGSGRSLGEENGHPLQDSCLENSMDRGAWWVIVHGVTKTEQLNNNKALIYTPSLTKQETLLYFFLFNFVFYIGIQPINIVIVSGEHERDSAICIHVSTLPPTPLLSRLPHNIEHSSLCYTVGPCWLSILNIAVWMCPNSLTISSSLPSQPATISSKSVSLFLFYKFICIISFQVPHIKVIIGYFSSVSDFT